MRTTCCLYLIEQVYLVTNHDLHYQRLWKDREEQEVPRTSCSRKDREQDEQGDFTFVNRFVDLLRNIYQCLFRGAVIAIGILTFI